MDANAILERAKMLGVTLSVDGDRILFRPKSRAPEDLIQAMREHKPELIVCLGNRSNSGSKELLAWAANIAVQDLVLEKPVDYIEAENRNVTTQRVSFYASQYLSTISYARGNQSGSWGIWTAEWWRERELEALEALGHLKQALDETGHIPGNSRQSE